MTVSQHSFAQAVLSPDIPVPAGLRIGTLPAGRRFSVYRNNVVAGLADALTVGFPVLERLLGKEFFRAMACVFVREHPPNSPLLSDFGHSMPEFLASFPPVEHLPYLPDVARLEMTLRQSYNAADVTPIPPDTLAGLSEGEIASARISFAPSARLLRSPHPVFSIWQANTNDTPYGKWTGEDVLVVRRGFDPEPLRLNAGEYEFLSALVSGSTILEAHATGSAANPEFRLEAVLGQLLAFNAVKQFLLTDRQ